MLTFKTLASGSTGNAYVVSDGETDLLLEAGIPFKQLQRLMKFQTSKLQGVLISHEHGDHCAGIKTFIERGMDIYMSEGTKQALRLDAYNVYTTTLDEAKSAEKAKVYKPFKIGTFNILPFGINHDVSEPLGFLIQSTNGKKLLFLTDSYYCNFNFSGISIFAVECNYDDETLRENVATGKLEDFQYKRVMKSHMGLERLVEFFEANDLSKCEEIYLLHLSSRNANREKIFEEVAKTTGKAITIVG